MTKKTALYRLNWLLISLLFLEATIACRVQSQNVYGSGTDEPNVTAQDQDKERVRELIRQFHTADPEQIDRVKRECLELVSKSGRIRDVLVAELLDVAKRYSELHEAPEDYGLWKGAVLTLGELRAEEAIELLTRCLDCNNGLFSLHLETFPGAFAVANIGPRAIPKLIEIVEQEPEQGRFNRFLAVLILSRIGGKNERRLLRQTLETEKDPQVREMMRSAVKRMESSN